MRYQGPRRSPWPIVITVVVAVVAVIAIYLLFFQR
jgi:hypothetical protein